MPPKKIIFRLKKISKKKLLFPIFVLLLFFTFGFFYYINFISSVPSEDALQAQAGILRLDDFTVRNFFQVENIASFNNSTSAVVWNVTGSTELKECGFFPRKAKVNQVKVPLNGQQITLRYYENIEIRDMRSKRDGLYLGILGIDSKFLNQDKLIKNNCGLVLIKKDSDGPVNINQYINSGNSKKIPMTFIIDGKEEVIEYSVTDDEYNSFIKIQRDLEESQKQLSQRNDLATTSSILPDTISVKFSIQKFTWEVSLKTKTMSFSTRLVSKPNNLKPAELQQQLRAMQNSAEMVSNITRSMASIKSMYDNYKK